MGDIKVSAEDVVTYKLLGHTGFIIRYREEHNLEDPSDAYLDELCQAATRTRRWTVFVLKILFYAFVIWAIFF